MDGRDRRKPILDGHNIVISKIGFTGKVSTAPMDWEAVQEQLEEIDASQVVPVLPIVGDDGTVEDDRKRERDDDGDIAEEDDKNPKKSNEYLA